MALTAKKIEASEYTGNDISGLSNTPSSDGVSATTLKERFDSIAKNVVIPKYNALIDMLMSVVAGSSGARQIGYEQSTRIPHVTVYEAIEHALDTTDALDTAKVDKVTGKSLLSDTEITRLAGIETGANAYVHPSTHSADILTDGTTNKAYLATERIKLAGIEASAEVNNMSDANVSGLTDGADTTLHTHDGRYYTETEADTLLSGKSDTSHLHDDRYFTETEVTNELGLKVDKAPAKSLLADTEITRLLGIATGAEVNAVDTVAGRTGDVVLAKADVGLGSVDNTADTAKPVSTAQATAIGLKANKLMATNIITNGDFSNGQTGWAYNAVTGVIANNEVTLTPTILATGTGLMQSKDAVSGNKYYFSYSVYPKYATNAYFGLPTAFVIKPLTTANAWNRVSDIIIPATSGYDSFMFYHHTNTGGYALTDTFKIKNLIVINLTAIFGAGNEPTASEMDALLSYFPNSWFDGTVELAPLVNILRTKADKAQEAWITPTLVNGWQSDSGYPFCYMKDSLGFVHFKGRLIAGTANTLALTMLVGYRPNPLLIYKARSGNGTDAMMYIDPNGYFVVESVYNGFVDFGALIYKAEQ